MAPIILNFFRLPGKVCRTVSCVCKHNLKANLDVQRRFHATPRLSVQTVLGIETSCDDTGIAVVDTDGNLLGDALKSQLPFHNANGGVIPPIAANLHKKNLVGVLDAALSKAGVKMEDIDAIATTVKPGLGAPLEVGLAFGSHLARKYMKPFIPIHHMEAHALAIRMIRKDVEFPYLTLLISGGHSLLAVVRSVDKFELIGDNNGIAVGTVLDKVARRLKLMNFQEFRNVSGGRAVEILASRATDVFQYQFPVSYLKEKTCNINLCGLLSHCLRSIENIEMEHDVAAGCTIPGLENFCAGVQLSVTHYLCLRVQYAMTLVRYLNLIEVSNPFLVVSGGAACNQFFRESFEKVCNLMDFRLAVPPPKLCTDNGVMIAWNGVEKLRANCDILSAEEAKNIRVGPSCPLGVNISESLKEHRQPCDWISAVELLGQCTQDSSCQKKTN